MSSKHYDSLDAFAAALPGLAYEIGDRLRGQSGRFALRTRQGRELGILLEDGRVTLTEAPVPDPDCAVEADEQDLLALVNGELSPMKALLFGRVRVRGDKALLLKLAALV